MLCLLCGGSCAQLDWDATDWVIIPVHLGTHWTLAVVDVPAQTLHFYDSMTDPSGEALAIDRRLFKAIFRWVSDDSADKLGEERRIDTADWNLRTYASHEIPQQRDGCNCGVFMVTFAACIAMGRTFSFDASIAGLNKLRLRMVLEILSTS